MYSIFISWARVMRSLIDNSKLEAFVGYFTILPVYIYICYSVERWDVLEKIWKKQFDLIEVVSMEEPWEKAKSWNTMYVLQPESLQFTSH